MRYSKEITEYIYKQMSPLQREAFERKLEEDPEMAAEVREQQEMLEAVRAAHSYEEAMNDPHLEEAERIAKEILEARKKDTPAKGKKVRRISLRMIPAAAAAALIIFVDLLADNLLSDTGIAKNARRRLGFRVGITRKFGEKLGLRLAGFLSKFRKR